MRSCNFNILKHYLIKIYSRFKKLYNNNYSSACLNNFNLDPPSASTLKDRKKMREYELIIESGFFTYFLISLYMDLEI